MMVIPCLCLSRFSSCTATTKKVPRPKGLAASFLIDIPTHWEPRTNKHPTGVFVAPPAAWPCCSSPVPPTTKKVPRPKVWGLVVEHCQRQSNLQAGISLLRSERFKPRNGGTSERFSPCSCAFFSWYSCRAMLSSRSR